MLNFALKTKIFAILLLSGAAQAQTYEAALIPPQINGSPQSMTPLQLGDDAVRRVPLGFDFVYWDQTFDEAYVSSNGFVSFANVGHLCCNGRPMATAPRNTIYAYWTDLINYTGNPYFTRGEGSILFGWYGANEYGTNNPNTFEIGLFDDGKIQFNYGEVSSSPWRTIAAGLTGPGPDDNIQLFFGNDTQYLRNQSGIVTWASPEPLLDCRLTPSDPNCPPQDIAVNTGAPDPVAAALEPIVEAVMAQLEAPPVAEETAQGEQIESEDIPEIQQIREIAEEALAIAEQVAETSEVTVFATDPDREGEEARELGAERAEEREEAERLTPEQVAALAADSMQTDAMQEAQASLADAAEQEAQSQSNLAQETQASQMGQLAFSQDTQSQSAMVDAFVAAGAVRFDAMVSGGVFTGSFSAGGSGAPQSPMGSSPIEMAISSTSPTTVTTTLEILNSMPPPPTVVNVQQSEDGMSAGQSETIAEMGSVPAFDAYRQAALQDRPDFYAVRDIYRNRRLADANLELYRILQTNDAKWREMVDGQYGRE